MKTTTLPSKLGSELLFCERERKELTFAFTHISGICSLPTKSQRQDEEVKKKTETLATKNFPHQNHLFASKGYIHCILRAQ